MTRVNLTALLLAEDESCLALDRKILRHLGVTHTQFFSSGRKALDYLQDLAKTSTPDGLGKTLCSIDILICNERLADMTGLRFLSYVRNLTGMEHIPALFLVCNTESTVALAARASKSCSVLARPYTHDQANIALHDATLPEKRNAPLRLPPSFTDRFGSKTEPQQKDAPLLRRRTPPQAPVAPNDSALHQGLAALQRGDTISADRLLYACYQADPNRVETCLALSKLCASVHKKAEEIRWVCKAGVLSFKHGDKPRGCRILSRLPRGKSGQTPLLAEAGLLLQEGEAKAAALAFLEAHLLDPAQPLHTLIGRTCMFTPTPEEHMRGLILALANAGHNATANRLNWRLLQPPKEEEEDHAGFFQNFPLLCDIVSIAAHTFKTWRHAA